MKGKFRDRKKMIYVVEGERFLVKLESNPTTGYNWQAHFIPAFIRQVGKKFEPISQKIGTGGIEKFEFQALRKGKSKIKMEYKRPWGEKTIKEKIFEVKITPRDKERNKSETLNHE